MKLHKLTFANLDQPRLSADDPDATVWIGGETKPDIIAKRVGDWCWFRIDELATYQFPPTSPDLSVTCVADPYDERSHRTVVDAYYRSVVPLALQVYGLEAMHGTFLSLAERHGLPVVGMAVYHARPHPSPSLSCAVSVDDHDPASVQAFYRFVEEMSLAALDLDGKAIPNDEIHFDLRKRSEVGQR